MSVKTDLIRKIILSKDFTDSEKLELTEKVLNNHQCPTYPICPDTIPYPTWTGTGTVDCFSSGAQDTLTFTCYQT